MKTKKLFLLAGIFLILQACSATKEAQKTSEEATIPALVNGERYLGTVHLSEKCGTTIDITAYDHHYLIKPAKMESKFEVENLRVKCTFNLLKESRCDGKLMTEVEITEMVAYR